jgi:hypothetical protein
MFPWYTTVVPAGRVLSTSSVGGTSVDQAVFDVVEEQKQQQDRVCDDTTNAAFPAISV